MRIRIIVITVDDIKSYVNSAISISRELATAWTSGAIPEKEALQRIVSPEGIYYNLENEAFRTIKVNEAFEIFASLNGVCRDIKQKQDSINAILSSQVGVSEHISNLFWEDLVKIGNFRPNHNKPQSKIFE
jgi:hypothetical protein